MVNLSLYETRVIGVLIEKSATTPDQFPLSLNALTTGCNQKTNREPVLELSEAEVQDTIDSLDKKGYMQEVRFGSRVPKYQHRFANTEFSEFKFNKKEISIICVLFLRGPQTPGELRTRTNRLCEFTDVQETEQVLQKLQDENYIVKLERQPGKRESRYAHLFSGEVTEALAGPEESAGTTTTPLHNTATPAQSTDESNALEERIEILEMTVEDLQTQVDGLKDLIEQLTS